GGPVGIEQLDLRFEDRHRDGHIRWMGGDAGVARPQDCVPSVDAADRRAARSRITLVAACGQVVEVSATGTLQELATDGSSVAKLAGGAGEQRVRENGVAG